MMDPETPKKDHNGDEESEAHAASNSSIISVLVSNSPGRLRHQDGQTLVSAFVEQVPIDQPLGTTTAYTAYTVSAPPNSGTQPRVGAPSLSTAAPVPNAMRSWCVKTLEPLFTPQTTKKLVCVLFTVLVLATLSVTLVFVLHMATQRKNDGSSSTSRGDESSSPLATTANLEERWNELVDLLVDRDLATPSVFLDAVDPRTQALQWMVYEDAPLVTRSSSAGAETDTDTDTDTTASSIVDRFLQRYTLIVFAYSTNQELWDVRTIWTELAGVHECDFEGIQCDISSQKVIEMNMSVKRLSGALPDALGLLTELTGLYVQRNELQGSLPEAIFQHLTKLEALSLGENDFVSTLSPAIGRLTNLRSLLMGHTPRITGSLPVTSMQHLTKLEELQIYNTELQGDVLDLMLAWPNLRRLGIEYAPNLVGTIPTEIGMLTALEIIFLTDITPAYLPTEIGMLTQLKQLHMDVRHGFQWDNDSMNDSMINTTIPTELGLLTQLKALNLDAKGGFSGPLPTELGQLSRLTLLGITDLAVTGTLPTELGRLTELEYMILSSNLFLTGTIPSELGALAASLTELVLEKSELTGTLPQGFCNHEVTVAASCRLIQCSCCPLLQCIFDF